MRLEVHLKKGGRVIALSEVIENWWQDLWS